MAEADSRAAVAARLEPPEFTRAQVSALREAWRAFWISRAVVWAAGMVAALASGTWAHPMGRRDPFGFAMPFTDAFANLLAAPAVRWDASWYLAVAEFGYDAAERSAFFPLYPALVALGGSVTGSAPIAGVILSAVCSIAALYLLHRLIAIDFGQTIATAAVWITACFPTAVTFSAVYSEGLFLLLSVGSLLAARRGKWALAGVLGGLAAATRSAGLLLILPLLIFYFWGPRSDRPPDQLASRFRRRYALRPSVLWIAVVPVGVAAFLGYLVAIGESPIGPFAAQSEWSRIFAPLAGIPLALLSAVRAVIELIPGVSSPIGRYSTEVIPEIGALRDLFLLGFGVLAAALVIAGARRKLPPAYQAYSLTSLALPLSIPAIEQPLMSLPRFMLVVFPLWIALALWAIDRGALRRVLVACLALSVVVSGLFSAWAMAP